MMTHFEIDFEKKWMNTLPVRLALFLVAVLLSATATFASADNLRLRLATTTSTANSGLLDVLLPDFEKDCGCKVDVIPVGTGQALKLGENGDVDILMVHAPEAEKSFVARGFGVDRVSFMENDFVVLGPRSDPAKIRGLHDAAAAFGKIRDAKAPFVSRGDDSGTYKKERAIWKTVNGNPEGPWYLEIGQGMGAALTVADNKGAYLLSDRGTYLSRVNDLGLEVLVEGGAQLVNTYSVIAVNPKKHPKAKSDLAQMLILWLASKSTQDRIDGYTNNGRPLFKGLRPGPTAKPNEATAF